VSLQYRFQQTTNWKKYSAARKARGSLHLAVTIGKPPGSDGIAPAGRQHRRQDAWQWQTEDKEARRQWREVHLGIDVGTDGEPGIVR
jgi:hypothetical protein